MEKTFVTRLNQAMGAKGAPEKHYGRISWLANIAGVAPSTARKWLEGASFPRQKHLEAIALSLEVSPSWLSGQGEQIIETAYVDVPVYSSMTTGGPLCFLQYIDSQYFTESFLGRHAPVRDLKTLFFFIVHSDSMWPSIKKEDLILASTCATLIEENSIYLMLHRKRVLLRRMQYKLDGTISVHCDNEHFDEEIIENGSLLTLHPCDSIESLLKSCQCNAGGVCSNLVADDQPKCQIGRCEGGLCKDGGLHVLAKVVWIIKKQI